MCRPQSIFYTLGYPFATGKLVLKKGNYIPKIQNYIHVHTEGFHVTIWPLAFVYSEMQPLIMLMVDFFTALLHFLVSYNFCVLFVSGCGSLALIVILKFVPGSWSTQ